MRSRRAIALVLAACATALGCYRTHYVHFAPQAAPPAGASEDSAPPPEPLRVSGWQSFFLYGWVPSERRIDARELCGGADAIESIRTQQTFLQGLVAAFAGYIVNIYSPYDAAVYCRMPGRASSAIPTDSAPIGAVAPASSDSTAELE